MIRRLGLRPRPRAVVWGARRGDRIIGSPEDLALAAHARRIAVLEAAQLEVFVRNLAALAALGRTSAESLDLMAEAVRRAGARMSDAIEQMRPAFERIEQRQRERRIPALAELGRRISTAAAAGAITGPNRHAIDVARREEERKAREAVERGFRQPEQED